jgi:cation diffusion facilitator family transporter
VQDEDKLKFNVQKWIVSISFLLLTGKFIAFYITNSVGILTDALESIVNVSAGLISLYCLKISAKPRDRKYPFGHGKIELISASMEGLLIFIAGGFIIFKGVTRLISPSLPEKLDIGILIIFSAGIINYAMGWYSIYIGKKHNSIALMASGKHLQSDTYSTIGLIAGLILLYFTQIAWIDSVLALLFGSIIIYTGISILQRTFANLVDKADKNILEQLSSIIESNRKKEWIDIHNLKITKHGNIIYIDCDLTLPWYYTILDGNNACDELKKIISNRFPMKTIVSIHSDSCNEILCIHCLIIDCRHRQKDFSAPLILNLIKLTEIHD